MRAMAFRPLAGIRVLDLTSSLAGPTATEILGALGADVLKIEHPGPGRRGSRLGPALLRGRQRHVLRRERGQALARARPQVPAGPRRAPAAGRGRGRGGAEPPSGHGRAARARAGRLRARNPRLVYATIGAFGRSGPLAAEPGYDPLMQAAAGIMSVTGEAERPPVRVGASLIDIGTGVWAALAIVAALHEGQGRTLDLSLYETALSLVPYQLVDVLGGRRAGQAARNRIPADRALPGLRDRRRRADDRRRERPSLREGVRGRGGAGARRRRALRDESAPDREPGRADPAAAERIAPRRPTACSPGSARPVFPPRRSTTSPRWRRRSSSARPGSSRSSAGASSSRRRSRPTGARSLRLRAALLGQHSREILAEAGFSEAEIDALVRFRRGTTRPRVAPGRATPPARGRPGAT